MVSLFVLILCTAPEFCRIFWGNERVTATKDLLEQSLSHGLGCRIWRVSECMFMELHKRDALVGTPFGILHLSWNPKFPLDFGDA